MSNDNHSKLEKWRAKYGVLVIALGCLFSVINSWGNNWILTGILGLSVLICGTIGIFDIKRAITEKNRMIKFYLLLTNRYLCLKSAASKAAFSF
ncbi:hypothetical protein P2R12_16040 [Cytobacillus oceanisediminis]|uniref:hypothetical protein n=1 Tax=Cytobacillus oceanisediminis TaxID=665099 RepID=UPI0023DBF005|nr:hypothetical protein [Cytobacillus oceanisediminis]MDF2038470.1 hypothetical protein [Cytobacillus oceanisediminis]